MNFRLFLAFLMVLLWAHLAQAAPIITSFYPTFDGSNDLTHYVNIYGSGFYVGSGNVTVKFNGVTSVPAAHVTDTYGTNILAHVAAGTTLGPTLIYVQLTTGASCWSTSFFTVIGPAPYVYGFSPIAGNSNTPVVITGAHFASVSGAPGVQFNGKNASSYHVDTDDGQIAQITAYPPVGATIGPIKVTSGLGSWTTTSNFFVPPVITGFLPVTGRAGTNLVIKGINFTQATAVLFSGTGGPFSLQILNPTVQNDNTIQVTVPAGATNGPIRVDTPAGSPAITTSNFIIQPSVFGFFPGSGAVNASVTVTGANFNVGTPTVKFGGATAATPTGITFSQLIALVPNGATNAPITVSTPNGSMTSTQIFHLPPSITGFLPTNAAPGTMIRVNGQNFIDATAVTFTGTSPVSPFVTNNTTLGVAVPAGVITGPISVTTPAGTASSSQYFYGAPVVNNFTPTHGLPGTNVTLIGTNFLAATAVKFNGTTAPLPVNVVNNGQINTTVPAGATTGPISVLGPAGVFTTAGSFTLDSSDLAVTVTDSPDPVMIGSNLVYTITIANNGAFSIPNVMLTNTLPATATFKSSTTSQGSLDTSHNPILGSLGTIASGAAATVTLTVAPQAEGAIVDTASVGGAFPDPNLANNSGSVSTTVWPVPLLSIAGLTNQVQISWALGLSNFTLQFKDILDSARGWSNTTVAPSISGGSNIVVEPVTNASRFYRLKL
jgi:uncharacterized repeat protein (TIGR01451 family)